MNTSKWFRPIGGLILLMFVVMSYNLPFTGLLSHTPFKYAWNAIQLTSLTLRGQAQYLDIVQDFVGFRALINRSDAYPIITEALVKLGLDWQIGHASTHPPTAYILTAPVAFLPWRIASTLWAWLMVGCLFGSVWCFTKSSRRAVMLTPLLMLWPPVAFSLSQFTLLWLLAAAVVYRFHEDKPNLCGVVIGLASLAKFFPGVLALVFVVKKQWTALLAVALVWIIAIALVYALHPQAVRQYIETNFISENSQMNAGRIDNTSLVITVVKYYGLFGTLLLAGLLGGIFWRFRHVFIHPESSTNDIVWSVASYFSVVLLPISWVYSIAPQIAILFLFGFTSRATMQSKFIAITTVALLFFVPLFGPWSVAPLCLVNVLLALGFYFIDYESAEPKARTMG